MGDVEKNLAAIKQTIKQACSNAGRREEDIHIIAVTKYVSMETAERAIEAGISHLGENRIEGALDKWEKFQDKASFHFIGQLQSKKAKKIIGKYEYIHSLDRISLAEELEKRLENGSKVKCFVQVNVSGESSKAGLDAAEAIPFIQELEAFSSIEVVGLMTMAPYEEDPEKTRSWFRELRMLRDRVQELGQPNAPCKELSMGMSNDYAVAIEEGATYIRLGTSLVGNETNA
ncbi:YggS family pyridoxal phosphate-dependent enzyme [Sinobaca sp. H24]|uniref:YggS family pyridoxal phosphate-dependent enzyme n=1 Tax=Sinobaca sp. H24 TaxID=2923376 RepID=UPI002079503B|nr:YggS family pyridoxal phosphate-dependent enzyme [Sinobaca sp. H24]